MLGFYGIKICHYSINPSEGNMYCSSVVSILKHTKLLRLQSEPLFTKYVLECRVLLHDMIGLIPYPVVLLMCYRHTFMYTVRPFKDYYSVLSGPRSLGLRTSSTLLSIKKYFVFFALIDFCTFDLVTDQLCDLFF
jgi:hypothetical protein